MSPGTPEVQKADPAARRKAILIVVIGALIGALLIGGIECYRDRLADWIGDAVIARHGRVRFLFLLVVGMLSAPLVVFAVRLWSLGNKVRRAQQCPPPGYRLIRDTRIIRGSAAVMRGRIFKILSAGLVVALGLLFFLAWRLARTLGGAG